jgi:hypothetical protein
MDLSFVRRPVPEVQLRERPLPERLRARPPDDIAGAQAIYGARKADQCAAASNGTLATATSLSLNSSGAFTINAELRTTTDVDYYSVTAPTGGNGTLTVTLNARDFSLLTPKLTVYDASDNVLATTTATTYGAYLTLNLSGLTADQKYFIGVDRAANDYFGQGAYQLTAQFGVNTATAPTLSPDRYDPNGSIATVVNLGTLSSTNQDNLTLDTPASVDYFCFTATTTASYTISVSGAQSGGTGGSLGLTVLNGSQTVLASGSSTTGEESFTLNLTSGLKYFIEVNSPSGSLFSYSLSVTSFSTTTITTTTSNNGNGHRGKPVRLLSAAGAEIGDGTELPSRVLPDTAAVQALLRTNSAPAGSQAAASLPTSGTNKTGQTPLADAPLPAPVWSKASDAVVLRMASVPAKPVNDAFWLDYPDDMVV